MLAPSSISGTCSPGFVLRIDDRAGPLGPDHAVFKISLTENELRLCVFELRLVGLVTCQARLQIAVEGLQLHGLGVLGEYPDFLLFDAHVQPGLRNCKGGPLKVQVADIAPLGHGLAVG